MLANQKPSVKTPPDQNYVIKLGINKLVLSSQGLAGTKIYCQWLWLPILKSGQRTEGGEARQRKTEVFQHRKATLWQERNVTIEKASHCHGFQCLLNTVPYTFIIQQSVRHIHTCTNLVVTYSVPTVFDKFQWFLMTQGFLQIILMHLIDRFSNKFIICDPIWMIKRTHNRNFYDRGNPVSYIHAFGFY